VSERPYGGWGSLGLGVGVPYELSLSALLAARLDRFVVRARAAAVGEFLGDSREDAGLLVGYVVSPGSLRNQVTLGAGIGRVSGENGCVLCGSSRTPSAWGFLLDLEWLLSFTDFLGVTMYAFADFNSVDSFGGAAFGLYLGRF